MTDSRTELVVSACRLIEQFESLPRLEELAQSAGMSASHFHRLFKAKVGMTPKAYSNEVRNHRLRDKMSQGDAVARVVYDAGFQSPSRFYAKSTQALGMKPAMFRRGGTGVMIRFAVGECSLGSFLVAATEHGVCAVLLGDEPEPLIHDLERRFQNAELISGDEGFEKIVSLVLSVLDDSTRKLELPLDIRGTVFQQKVWRALQQILPGKTTTYTELAQQIGAPTAVRAVAHACAANPVAVAIPCHRVVRRDGSLAGYRWGIERKAKLLKREGESLARQRSN